MAWKSLLRKAGYDPSICKDSVDSFEVGTIERQDLNGAVIGDPCRCCGSKLIRRSLNAEMAWVGARFAVVVYSKKKIVRYRHNGGIPSMQDQGFFPIGQPMRLVAPSKTSRLGSLTAAQRNPGNGRKKPFVNRFPSIVGQFRR